MTHTSSPSRSSQKESGNQMPFYAIAGFLAFIFQIPFLVIFINMEQAPLAQPTFDWGFIWKAQLILMSISFISIMRLFFVEMTISQIRYDFRKLIVKLALFNRNYSDQQGYKITKIAVPTNNLQEFWELVVSMLNKHKL